MRALMNTHQNYTLASRTQTSRALRGWAVLSRGTFSGAIFLVDVALIVAMTCLTGVVYHLVAYGNPGIMSSFVRLAFWRRASSPFPTFSDANTGCRISSASSRMPGARSNFGM